MAQIKVKIRSDIGDPGSHPKYGRLVPGTEITIEEADFGAGLFERPSPNFLSPHEQADKARAAELKQRVGDYDPPADEPAPKVSKSAKEVTENA